MTRQNSGWQRVAAVALVLGATVQGTAMAQNEVREVPYQVDQVVRVNTGLGIATQIEINPQEQVKDFGTGFSSGWELVRRENVFYIRPKNVDVDTNMYIRTNKRSYLLDLRVSATRWKTLEEAKNAGVYYKVRFVYSSDGIPAKGSPMAGANAVLSPTSSQLNSQSDYHLNYDYAARSSSSTIVPVRVYDNQQFTYLHMPPLASFPAMFGRNERMGEEFLVNTKSEDNVIIVQGVYPYLVLRLGEDVVGLRRNQ
ncbi:TrbG/VirB9 family P-type conjugative transfer protein [Ottowia sp.]|uniref:TrbG/VirB9 family P-type conjugative transfer protein n=1 Tax=Ottowia sp. TaxID=1898956 RepID=UPI003A87D2E4